MLDKILNYLGGNEFVSLTGAERISPILLEGIEIGIGFYIPQKTKNSSNWIEILQESKMCYTFHFYRIEIRASEQKRLIESISGVSFKKLHTIFTEKTGLSTYL